MKEISITTRRSQNLHRGYMWPECFIRAHLAAIYGLKSWDLCNLGSSPLALREWACFNGVLQRTSFMQPLASPLYESRREIAQGWKLLNVFSCLAMKMLKKMVQIMVQFAPHLHHFLHHNFQNLHQFLHHFWCNLHNYLHHFLVQFAPIFAPLFAPENGNCTRKSPILQKQCIEWGI